MKAAGWILHAVCVYVCVRFVSVVCVKTMTCVCVFEGYKRISAGSILEGWGLWLRSGSAGALLYKTMAYWKRHVSDGVLVRSSLYISCLAVYTLVNGLRNA